MRFTWARLFYPYGPGEDSRRLISAAIASLRRGKLFSASEGRQVRDYIHAADVGRALACLVTQGNSCVYNVASGTPVTVRQILGVIATQLNEPNLIAFGRIPTHDWDPPVVCGDNSHLKKLGWSPEFDLENGIADTIAWFGLQPVQ
jgi:nucleoside-diphosphate-sugar epimerase